MRVLVIEDDHEFALYLTRALREAGYTPDLATNGLDGLQRARDRNHDVIIADRMLPGLDGLSLIGMLREEGIRTPVLILSALDKVDDRVEGLKAGGDDYVTKPCAFAELFARVEALHRRDTSEQGDKRYQIGDLQLDRLSRQVTRGGESIPLQPREFMLLEYLMRHAGQVVTRTMLLQNVWDYHFDPQTNVIDVHISRLRAKIDRHHDKPLLHTVRGAGYVIRDNTA